MERPERRSIRLRNYDYATPGAYFVTVCVQARAPLFGRIVDNATQPNEAGLEVGAWWNKLPSKFTSVGLDAAVVMPNHLHGIVWILGEEEQGTTAGRPHGAAPTNGEATTMATSTAGRPHGAAPTNGEGTTTATATAGRPHGAAPTNGKGTTTATSKAGRPHVATPTEGGERPALGQVLDWFKTMTTNAYIRGVKESGWPRFGGRLWQRDYYEHVVRDEEGLNRIREYIQTNPLRWSLDRMNPDRVGDDEFDKWLDRLAETAPKPGGYRGISAKKTIR